MMVLGCGAKVLKFCLFAFNLIFFVAGTVCLGVGLWMVLDNLALDRLVDATEQSSSELRDFIGKPAAVRDLGIVLASGGGVIFAIAFLGCCGAAKEWRPLLILYSICLMIILAAEAACAIYAGINKRNLESGTKLLMYKSIKDYDGTATTANGVRAAWDTIMQKYECCGIESKYNEFNNSKWFKGIKPPDPFPATCCETPSPWSPDTYCSAQSRRSLGCYQALTEVLESQLVIVISVGAAVGLIQLIGIIFALCLCQAISEQIVS